MKEKNLCERVENEAISIKVARRRQRTSEGNGEESGISRMLRSCFEDCERISEYCDERN